MCTRHPKKKKMFGQNMILVMNHVLCMGLKQNINENFRKKKYQLSGGRSILLSTLILTLLLDHS